MVYWVAVDEANRQLAIRFTRKMCVKINNKLGTQKIKVTHHVGGGQNGVIECGETAIVVNNLDVHPCKNDTDFTFHFTLDVEN